MFYGQARHTLDQKGRIILPSKYRELLGESFFVMRGFGIPERCLFVYTTENYHELEEKVRALPIAAGYDIQRFIFHYAENVVPDKQGRFVLPNHLRDFAELSKEIVIAGSSSRIEIWDATKYEDYENKMDSDPQKLMEAMKDFCI